MTTATTTEQVKVTFRVPDCNLDFFEAKMEKLSKGAKRLKSGDVGFNVLRTIVDKFERDGLEYEVTVHEVEVFGPAPKYAGWSLVGRLDFKEGVNGVPLRMMVPGETLSEQFLDADAKRCDHCGHRRRRNDSFVVRHEDGREVLVGRSCLKDFLGHQSPERLARLAEIVIEFGELRDEWGSTGYYSDHEASLGRVAVVAVARELTDKYGWVSKRSAWEGHPSTCGRVEDLLCPIGQEKPHEREERIAKIKEVLEKHEETAEQIIEWVMAQEADSDYMHNLKLALSGQIRGKTMGLAVSAIVAYDRAHKPKPEPKSKEEKIPSEHVGEVGERLEFGEVEVAFTREFEGHYGPTTLVKFKSGANELAWFASGEKDFEVGQKVTLKGTIKKHDEYNGNKQTVLTRCKVHVVKKAKAA